MRTSPFSKITLSDELPTALILAGGLGTRLRETVSDRPKSLAEVGGRPFLEWLIGSLVSAGTRHIVLAVGYMSDMIRSHFGDGSGWGAEILYSEDRGMGTAGAIRNALPFLPTEPVLILNGDSYCEFDLQTFIAWHRAHLGQGSIVLSRTSDTSRFGRVEISIEGVISQFSEKDDSSGEGWINAGIYLLSRQLIESIDPDKPSSLEREYFPRWAAKNNLYGFWGGGAFFDIGTPRSLREASYFFNPGRKARVKPSPSVSGQYVMLDRDGTINFERHYLSDPGAVELLPGVAMALNRLRSLGLGLVIITNQSAVGRGFFDLGRLDAIHRRLRELLEENGAHVDGIYACLHKPEDKCECRKPKTGLVREAAAQLGFDPKASFVVGDHQRDIELGRNVGCLTILVTTGYGKETEQTATVRPDFVVDGLPQAAKVIEDVLVRQPLVRSNHLDPIETDE